METHKDNGQIDRKYNTIGAGDKPQDSCLMNLLNDLSCTHSTLLIEGSHDSLFLCLPELQDTKR